MTDLLAYIAKRGECAHAMTRYEQLDRQALMIAATMRKYDRHIDDLRNRQGSPWLKDFCKEQADALERDPSGRLDALPSLQEWAKKHGISSWFNWYRTHLKAWLALQPVRQLEAAE